MTMPRLHPDDLEAIIQGVSQIVGGQVVHNIGKYINSTNQTYTIDQVAKFTNSNYTTILNHIKKGLLEAKKTGKNYTITQDALDKYIKRTEQ